MAMSSAITLEFAKFLTMASAYLYTSATAKPWNAWEVRQLATIVIA